MDEIKVFPSDVFGRGTKDFLAKAVTVALPYPPPATGTLYLGINPDSIEPDSKIGSTLRSLGLPRFFLRLVQTVSPQQVVTRILALEDLCGVTLPVGQPQKEAKPGGFQTVDDIMDVLIPAIRKLIAADKAKPGVYEILLFEKVVIHVRESAPVFLRVQYDFKFGVSAAEAAENVDCLVEGERRSCPCPTANHPPEWEIVGPMTR